LARWHASARNRCAAAADPGRKIIVRKLSRTITRVAQLFSAEDPESLRGPQFSAA